MFKDKFRKNKNILGEDIYEIKCPNCNKWNDVRLNVCAYCPYILAQHKKDQKIWIFMAIIFVFIFLLVLAGV